MHGDNSNSVPLPVSISLGIAKALIVPAPLIPAILINLDAAQGQGIAWTVFAIGSVLLAAMAVENVREAGSMSGKTTWCLIAMMFLSLNIMNALGNSAGHSGDLRDGKTQQQKTAQETEARIGQLQQSRAAQVEFAGESTVAAIDGEIQARQSLDANRWRMTDGCTPDRISAVRSREFCADIARLRAKKAAALKRDELDTQIASLREKNTGVVPSTTDPYAESITGFLATLGYVVDGNGKKTIAAARDWGRGIGVEIMAAVGPAGLLSLLSRLSEQIELAVVFWLSRARKQADEVPEPGTEIAGIKKIKRGKSQKGPTLEKMLQDMRKRPDDFTGVSVPDLAKAYGISVSTFRTWYREALNNRVIVEAKTSDGTMTLRIGNGRLRAIK